MPQNRDLVVLLHGLFRSASSMKRMGKYLRSLGYEVLNIQYESTKYDIPTLARKCAAFINHRKDQGGFKELHIVTHSMGGIITRSMLDQNLIAVNGKVVMLAPPNKGAVIIDKVKKSPLIPRLVGPAGMSLGTEADSLPNTLTGFDAPLGIIAGDSALNPFWAMITPKPCDSTVRVEDTKLAWMDDHITLHYIHSFIMSKKDVIRQTAHFLEHASFYRHG